LIPCAPVARPDQLFDDPHLNAEGGLVEVALNDTVRARLPALPIEMNGGRPALRRQPPAAGSDTQAVLAAAGVSQAEIDSLVADGVIDVGAAKSA
jgi:crotonobetainyl-CoA:carnitine CoA-transferase CaiB-like acyl-CoA transferase